MSVRKVTIASIDEGGILSSVVFTNGLVASMARLTLENFKKGEVVLAYTTDGFIRLQLEATNV